MMSCGKIVFMFTSVHSLRRYFVFNLKHVYCSATKRLTETCISFKCSKYSKGVEMLIE